MQGLRGRSSSSIQIELLSSLVSIHYLIEIPNSTIINPINSSDHNKKKLTTFTSLNRKSYELCGNQSSPVSEEDAAAEEDVRRARSEAVGSID